MRIKAIVLTIILSVVIALFAGLTSQKPALAQAQMEAEWETSSLFLWYDHDLLLNLCDPEGSDWHELHPYFGRHWELVEWKNIVPRDCICRGDLVKLRDIDREYQRSYEVTMTTVALYVKETGNESNYMYIEIPGLYSMAEAALTGPVGSKWAEVWPDFNVRYTITDWGGSGNLTLFDQITLDNGYSYTVEGIAFGLVLYVPRLVPVFPTWYVLAAAVVGAGVLAYFVRRRLVRQR